MFVKINVRNEMTYKTEQEQFWAEDFGLNYIDRNNSDPLLNTKMAMWAKMLNSANNVKSAKEFGCNIGLNLVALKRLKPQIELSGYEINEAAANKAKDFNVGNIYHRSILDKINDETVDLTFTVGVLIHINPHYINKVYDNLVNCSDRYVLIAEYYNPVPVSTPYRGYSDKLFKRDFAGDLIEKYKLKLVDYGFVYRRDNWMPQDDINWFLLEK